MANGKSTSARRREVRKNLGKDASSFSRGIAFAKRREFVWTTIFIAAMALFGGWITIHSTESPTYEVGQLITEPIVARISFDAVKEAETQQRRESARERTPAIYVANEEYYDELERQIESLVSLAKYNNVNEIPSADLEKNGQSINITPQGLDALRKYLNEDDTVNNQWRKWTLDFLRFYFSIAILNTQQYDQEHNWNSPGLIRLIHPHQLLESPTPQYMPPTLTQSRIFQIDDTEKLKQQIISNIRFFPQSIQPTLVELILATRQPNYLIDAELTHKARNEAYDAVRPVIVPYAANTVLIKPGILDEESISLIEQEQRAYLGDISHSQIESMSEEQLNRMSYRVTTIWFSRLGIIGIFLLIATSLWVYIYNYNVRLVTNPLRGFALTCIVLFALLITVIATHLWPEGLYATATFPALLATILLAIIYDQRFALAIGAAIVAMIMISLNLPVAFGMIAFTGIGIAAALLPAVKTSSTVVRVGAISGVVMFAAAILVGLATQPLYINAELKQIVTDALLALGSGITVGMCVQGTLPMIEKVFHITTAMTLKEYNDASKPLLQRLAQEAPGTYQHSLRIADMAESAAEAVGADPLLCRVGAMYHDIGKINKPMYFIENQGGGPNRHAKLSPAMSLLIIVGHVKDGIEMAREYALPRVLRHFIESHHGTTLVEYFYHAAKKQREAEDEAAPSEFEFRYPGPKPQTKEAAIMLICDGIEAAARTLPDPTPVRLEQLVSNIASKRLMDGQFDECNLTLAELHSIEEAITKTLCAIYHARIKYPAEDAAPDVNDESHAPQTQTGT
ncbi:HD family phosphohydrolase [Poriferisphaera sp. WC338]|uniref:HD family phosphohydrolase n=1 Tax=Poriferisphaera sp. WC338 TaxID=3425129 RepID=UPI003D81C141